MTTDSRTSFPKATGDDVGMGGWHLDPSFLKRMKVAVMEDHQMEVTLEQVEAVLRVAMMWLLLNGSESNDG